MAAATAVAEMEESIVQMREALVSSSGGVPTLRTARLLNHSITAIDDYVFELPVDAFTSQIQEFDPESWPVKFFFSGWGSPSVEWVQWVDAMAESHAATWRKAGVYDAVMVSRYLVTKNEPLVMGLVERWSIDTNTFVFQWGEATVTLEDMMILGGFSVTGNFPFPVLKRDEEKPWRRVVERLKLARQEIRGRCCGDLWMKKFKGSGSEIEHEAFLATWLSRFVFPDTRDVIREMLFPAAVQLAKGVRLALAPAVLAGIYRDLGLMKERIASYVHFGNVEEEKLVLTSSLQFVQVWAWERIIETRLQVQGGVNMLNPGEPRMARWHHHHRGVKYSKDENFRLVLDSSCESFDWRPYAKSLKNFRFPKFYFEDDCWVSVGLSVDEEVNSFARCLRFSKLVGLDCIEPYYPHRVAMQFGYDQDIPGMVPGTVETPELAWKDYIRPISEGMLYVPSRLYEGDVTKRYSEWWKQSVSALKSVVKKGMHLPQKQLPRGTTINEPQKQKSVMTVANSPKRLKTRRLSLPRESHALALGAKITPSRKNNGSDGERVQETKGKKFFLNSRIAVKRMKAALHESRAPASLKEAPKEMKIRNAEPLEKSEGIKRLQPEAPKGPNRSKNDIKSHKSAFRAPSRVEKVKSVRFLLPNSLVSSPKAQPRTPTRNSRDPLVGTLDPSLRTTERRDAEKGQRFQSCVPPIVSRQTSARPGKAKTEKDNINLKSATAEMDVSACPPVFENARFAGSGHVNLKSTTPGITATKPSSSKEMNISLCLPDFDNAMFAGSGHVNLKTIAPEITATKPQSVSDMSFPLFPPGFDEARFVDSGHINLKSTIPEITTMKAQSASEMNVSPCPLGFEKARFAGSAESSRKYSSNPSSIPDSRATEVAKASASEASGLESLKDTQVATKAYPSNLVDQMVVIRGRVGEEDERVYQIPKKQFEILSQGFQNVLTELQSINKRW